MTFFKISQKSQLYFSILLHQGIKIPKMEMPLSSTHFFIFLKLIFHSAQLIKNFTISSIEDNISV